MAKRRGRGEGCIYERADGRWEASIDLGFIDGKRVRKRFYAPTRKAVSSKQNKALGKHEAGGVVNHCCDAP